MESIYYTVEEVQELMNVSKPYAYKVIQQLNKEMSDKGYITVAGKVNKKYFNEKSYLNEHDK